MTREKRYPETSTFHYYNANPKNKIGGDCVVRAIATALNQSWETTVRELTEVGIKYGYVLNDTKTYEKYLKEKGWVKCKQPRKSDNTKFTGKEFCKGLRSTVVAHIGTHHIVAIVDGKINDIWDSSDGCIGNYWIKE